MYSFLLDMCVWGQILSKCSWTCRFRTRHLWEPEENDSHPVLDDVAEPAGLCWLLESKQITKQQNFQFDYIFFKWHYKLGRCFTEYYVQVNLSGRLRKKIFADRLMPTWNHKQQKEKALVISQCRIANLLSVFHHWYKCVFSITGYVSFIIMFSIS